MLKRTISGGGVPIVHTKKDNIPKSPLGSIPPHGKNFPVMEQNFMDRAKKHWVEGSNPPHSKNFSLSGAKFHGLGMGVWGGVGARG